MPPRDKAQELYDKFMEIHSDDEKAKKCVNIVVNEILNNGRVELNQMNKGYWEQVVLQLKKYINIVIGPSNTKKEEEPNDIVF